MKDCCNDHDEKDAGKKHGCADGQTCDREGCTPEGCDREDCCKKQDGEDKDGEGGCCGGCC